MHVFTPYFTGREYQHLNRWVAHQQRQQLMPEPSGNERSRMPDRNDYFQQMLRIREVGGIIYLGNLPTIAFTTWKISGSSSTCKTLGRTRNPVSLPAQHRHQMLLIDRLADPVITLNARCPTPCALDCIAEITTIAKQQFALRRATRDQRDAIWSGSSRSSVIAA